MGEDGQDTRFLTEIYRERGESVGVQVRVGGPHKAVRESKAWRRLVVAAAAHARHSLRSVTLYTCKRQTPPCCCCCCNTHRLTQCLMFDTDKSTHLQRSAGGLVCLGAAPD